MNKISLIGTAFFFDTISFYLREDVWTLMSMMHALIVVTMVLVLDTAQVFLRDSTEARPVLLRHVEGFFIFLYLVSIAWMIVVIVLKRPLPSSDDEERLDTQAGSRYLNGEFYNSKIFLYRVSQKKRNGEFSVLYFKK